MPNSTSDEQTRPDEIVPTIEWSLWFQWVLATTLGWLIGFIIGEGAIGVALGLGQWLVLRQWVREPGWWIWASTVGWAIGWILIITEILPPPQAGIIAALLAGAVLGLMLGVAQWFILRRLVDSAGWWVLVSTTGWAIGFSGLLGITVVGTVAGAVTGFALDFLLRYPHHGSPTS